MGFLSNRQGPTLVSAIEMCGQVPCDAPPVEMCGQVPCSSVPTPPTNVCVPTWNPGTETVCGHTVAGGVAGQVCNYQSNSCDGSTRATNCHVEPGVCGAPAPVQPAPVAPAQPAPVQAPAPRQEETRTQTFVNNCQGKANGESTCSNGKILVCRCFSDGCALEETGTTCAAPAPQQPAPVAPAPVAPAPAAPTQEQTQQNNNAGNATGGNVTFNPSINVQGGSVVNNVTREVVREVQVPVTRTVRVVTAQAQPQATSTAVIAGTKELPKTGLPLAFWAAAAFVPAGLRMKKFGKAASENVSASYLWELRQYNSDKS